MFGYKVFNNSRKYLEGTQTGYESTVNIAVDAGRIVGGGIMATGGAKIGGAIGTLFDPGIGTIIGGGIGVTIGAIAGSSAFNYIKERFKWGKIIDSIEYFGRNYKLGLSGEMNLNLKKKYFNIEELNENKNIEIKLLNNYRNQLNPYESEKITVTAVLANEYYNSLVQEEKRINIAVQNLPNAIEKVCNDVSKKVYPSKIERASERFYGEILLSNQELFNYDSLNDTEKRFIDEYNDQIEIAYNHPYRFNQHPKEILEGIVFNEYKNANVINTEDQDNSKYIIAMTIMVIGILIFLFGIIKFFII